MEQNEKISLFRHKLAQFEGWASLPARAVFSHEIADLEPRTYVPVALDRPSGTSARRPARGGLLGIYFRTEVAIWPIWIGKVSQATVEQALARRRLKPEFRPPTHTSNTEHEQPLPTHTALTTEHTHTAAARSRAHTARARPRMRRARMRRRRTGSTAEARAAGWGVGASARAR